MARTLRLEVVTPDRLVFSEDVDFFSLRGRGGELGILPGHIPLFTTLDSGLLHYKQGGEDKVVTVMGGFLNVQPDKATVLADAAERGEEIDAARAKQAKERAEMAVSRQGEAAAEIALQRALLRLKAIDLVGNRVRR